MIKEVFRKIYDSESIVDVEQDLHDLSEEILEKYNIPKDESGFYVGEIEVIVNLHYDE